ncbi:MAG: hypothetical protein RE472_07580 [Thermoplasmatales archaeon]|jgi:hypothetical protein|nr:MAG: hypothetical protein AMDU5_GPLC00001G0004 [Thermoplasmatales archaeon Gpl]WMT48922.1 MAG: hypothetical protein RE472_07580 [Thermoplasmatales archaeon]
MKLTKLIFIAAFSIICVFLIVSASSIYVSAENDLKDIELSFVKLEMTNGKLTASMDVSARNTNALPSTVSIFNNNLTINPYSSSNSFFNVPINITSLTAKGWPTDSIIYYANAVISEFLNGVGVATLSRNISTQLPFLFTNVSLVKSSNNNTYTLFINDMIPIGISVIKVGMYMGENFLGNLSFVNQSGNVSGNLSLSGVLDNSNLLGNLSSVFFDFLGVKLNLAQFMGKN